MPTIECSRSVPVHRSPRVMQLEGIFDVPPTEESVVRWSAHLPIEERAWNIGLIVGPSGCGKSTIARELFADNLVDRFDWPADASIVDAFPVSVSIRDVTALLSSVGFSSPPAWLRPFRVLSGGEQFRVTIARALAESSGEAIAIDEFTSVVDRTVARIGSAAIAKAVRRRNLTFVAVSCHYDIVDWLDPDWTYEPAGDTFQWRCERLGRAADDRHDDPPVGQVQPPRRQEQPPFGQIQLPFRPIQPPFGPIQPPFRRPGIELEICRVRRTAWKLFGHHHYLNNKLHPGSQCFVGFVEGQPAAMTAVLSFPHPVTPGWREHRTVCLPDYQGVGIGNALSEFVASVFRATGKPYRSTTSNPAMIHHRARSPLWRMIRSPSRATGKNGGLRNRWKTSGGRVTASFQFTGPPLIDEARELGVPVAALFRMSPVVTT